MLVLVGDGDQRNMHNKRNIISSRRTLSKQNPRLFCTCSFQNPGQGGFIRRYCWSPCSPIRSPYSGTRSGPSPCPNARHFPVSCRERSLHPGWITGVHLAQGSTPIPPLAPHTTRVVRTPYYASIACERTQEGSVKCRGLGRVVEGQGLSNKAGVTKMTHPDSNPGT